MNKYIRSYLFLLLFVCVQITKTAPIPTLVTPGYLTVGLVDLQSNYVNFTESNGVITAGGFDVDIYCYIAQQLGLKIKFLGYEASSASASIDPYGNAAAALDALEIDCFGGADFFLANVHYPVELGNLLPVLLYSDYYGIVTSVYPTIPSYSGIAFLAVENALTQPLRCELLELVQRAVDRAVSSGYWTCALRKNNADGEYVAPDTYVDLTGNNRSPEALLSATLGLIPVASSQGITNPDFGCKECIFPQLPKRSCLVDYIAARGPKNCNKTVTLQYSPAPG
jgi:hypothetical protein